MKRWCTRLPISEMVRDNKFCKSRITYWAIVRKGKPGSGRPNFEATFILIPSLEDAQSCELSVEVISVRIPKLLCIPTLVKKISEKTIFDKTESLQ